MFACVAQPQRVRHRCQLPVRGAFLLSIDRPRRIFRSARRPTAPRRFFRTLSVALLAGAAGAGLVTVGLSGRLFGQMTAEPRVIAAGPGQVAVIDGDTLRLDGIVVRLSDVQALPRGEACAAGPDCGGQATVVLASLLRDHRVECRVSGHDSMGRPAVRCDAGGQDVGLALVATGWARASNAALQASELDAKAHGRGIWLTP